MPNDTQFLDVDFRREVPQGKSLGCIPETAEMMRWKTPDLPVFGAAESSNLLIPESQWEALAEQLEEELRSLVWEIKDQDGEGQCVGAATVGAMQYRMMFSMGFANCVRLSAESIYKPISTGPNSGAYVSDGAMRASEFGALPAPGQGYAHEHPEVDWYEPLPAGCEETAKLFRARVEFADSRQAIFSAALQGKPTQVGRRGHSIYYFLPKKVNGVWRIGYANSWHVSWGDFINEDVPGGLGWDTWSNMATSGYVYDDVTFRSEVELP